MTSAIDITQKLIEAHIEYKDEMAIVYDYMREIFEDMGYRYGYTEITHHILAAVFKMQSDLLYSSLDELGRKACDNLIESVDFSAEEIKIPLSLRRGGGKE